VTAILQLFRDVGDFDTPAEHFSEFCDPSHERGRHSLAVCGRWPACLLRVGPPRPQRTAPAMLRPSALLLIIAAPTTATATTSRSSLTRLAAPVDAASAASAVPAPAACDCAGFCAGACSLPTPAEPPSILTVYRLTPTNITDLVNKDTGDAAGDAFFTLDEYDLPMRCINGSGTEARGCFLDVRDIYIEFEVAVDGKYGPCECMGAPSGTCMRRVLICSHGMAIARRRPLQPTESELSGGQFLLPRNGSRPATQQLPVVRVRSHERYCGQAACVDAVWRMGWVRR
jgi:hypothetical protein